MNGNKLVEVSAIIPVYNGENYISYLIKDIKNQTYKKVEYIFIDDGSVDKTFKILESSFAKNKNVKIIKQKNQGVSAARNKGIEVARGKYILFIDSDDRLSPDFIRNYVNKIKNNHTDIEVFSAAKINDNKTKNISGYIQYTKLSNKKNISSEEFIKDVCAYQVSGYIWSFIFKKNLWENIRFKSDISVWEDLLAVFLILLEYPNIKIHFNKEYYYYYYQRKDSILHTTKLKDLKQKIEVTNIMIERCKNNLVFADLVPYLEGFKVGTIYSIIKSNSLDKKSLKELKQNYKNSFKKAKFVNFNIKVKRLIQYLIIIFNIDLKDK